MRGKMLFAAEEAQATGHAGHVHQAERPCGGEHKREADEYEFPPSLPSSS